MLRRPASGDLIQVLRKQNLAPAVLVPEAGSQGVAEAVDVVQRHGPLVLRARRNSEATRAGFVTAG